MPESIHASRTDDRTVHVHAGRLLFLLHSRASLRVASLDLLARVASRSSGIVAAPLIR